MHMHIEVDIRWHVRVGLELFDCTLALRNDIHNSREFGELWNQTTIPRYHDYIDNNKNDSV